MSSKWQQLLAKLDFTHSDSGIETLSEEQLQIFELNSRIILPAEYKEFCQTLGTGSLWDFVCIYCPSDFLLATQNMLERMSSQIKQYPSQNPKRDRDYIELLNSAFIFGEYGAGGSLIFWDLRTYRESDQSYDIYWADWETPEADDCILVGRSFFEFVRDFCYGLKSFELVPHLMKGLSPEDIEYTFTRFKPSEVDLE